MSYDRAYLAVNPVFYDWDSIEAKKEARARLHSHALEWRDDAMGSVYDWLTVVAGTDAATIVGEDELKRFVQVVFFFKYES